MGFRHQKGLSPNEEVKEKALVAEKEVPTKLIEEKEEKKVTNKPKKAKKTPSATKKRKSTSKKKKTEQ